MTVDEDFALIGTRVVCAPCRYGRHQNCLAGLCQCGECGRAPTVSQAVEAERSVLDDVQADIEQGTLRARDTDLHTRLEELTRRSARVTVHPTLHYLVVLCWAMHVEEDADRLEKALSVAETVLAASRARAREGGS